MESLKKVLGCKVGGRFDLSMGAEEPLERVCWAIRQSGYRDDDGMIAALSCVLEP